MRRNKDGFVLLTDLNPAGPYYLYAKEGAGKRRVSKHPDLDSALVAGLEYEQRTGDPEWTIIWFGEHAAVLMAAGDGSVQGKEARRIEELFKKRRR